MQYVKAQTQSSNSMQYAKAKLNPNTLKTQIQKSNSMQYAKAQTQNSNVWALNKI